MALALRLRRAAVALSSSVHSRPSPSSSPLPLLANPNPNPNPLRPHSMIQSQSFRSSPSAWAAYRNDSSGGQDIDPKEILFEGCDYNHWLVTIDFPKDPKPSPEEMVEFYVQTCAKVFGSVEEAKKRIYACSTTTYEGFQAVMTEEVSEEFKKLPNVVFVLPDSYIDPVNKQYGGDKYDNGVITPRPPPVQYRQRPDRRNFNQPRYSGSQEQSPQQGYRPRDLPPPVQGGQNYGPPRQNYGPPHSGSQEQGPQQGYRPRDLPPPVQDGQNYGPPRQNYGPPHSGSQEQNPQQQGYRPRDFPPPVQDGQNYGPPKQNYGPPQQNYGPPQQNYVPPQQNYGPSQQNYGPPQQNYGPPRQNNGPPPGQGGRAFGPPGGRDSPSGEMREFGQVDRRVVGPDGGREFNQGQGGNYAPQGQQNFSGGQGEGSDPASNGEPTQTSASSYSGNSVPGYGGNYNPGQSYSGSR